MANKKKPKAPFQVSGVPFTYEQWAPKGTNPYLINEFNGQQLIDEYKQIYSKSDLPTVLTRVAQQFPDSPELALSFAKANLNDDTLAAAQRIHSILSAADKNYAESGYKPSAENNIDYHDYLNSLDIAAEKATEKDKQDAGWFAGLKRVTRLATAGLFTGYELMTNAIRQADGAYSKATGDTGDSLFNIIGTSVRKGGGIVSGPDAYNPMAILKGTTLYQHLINNKDMGTGFIIGGDAVQAKEEASSHVVQIKSPSTNSLKNYTVGGALATSAGLDPEETAYKTLSGIIDAVISLRADPLIVAGNIKRSSNLKKSAEELRAATDAGQTAANISSTALKHAKDMAKVVDKDVADSYKDFNLARAELDNLYEQVANKRIDYATLEHDAMLAGMPASIHRISGVKELVENRTSLLQKLAEQKKTAVGLVNDPVTGNAMTKKNALSYINKEIKSIEEQINSSLDTIYIERNPKVKSLIQAKQKVMEDKLKVFTANLEQSKKIASPEAKRAFIEREHAGIVEGFDGYKVNRDIAMNWVFGKNADVALERIADVTSPSEIMRLSKGKFSASLSRELAAADNVGEVETILLGRIGIDVNRAIPRGLKGRYIVNNNPNWIFGDPVRQVSSNKFLKQIKFLKEKMPTMKEIHLANTDGLAEEVRRWMVATRHSVEDIDSVVDQIVASDPHAYMQRQDIITGMLDRTVSKYAAEQNISPRIVNELKRVTAAYKSSLTGLRQYSSEIIDEGFGNKVIIDGEIFDLTNTPTSIGQLAHTIALPNAYKVRELTGLASRVSRSIDNVIANDSRLAERATYAGARFIRGANDGFMKSILMAGRISYITRNILEMQVRMYLSGGMGLLSNPVGFLGMIMSNPKSAKSLMKHMANVDPYLVDVNGKAFMEMLKTDTPRTQEAFTSFANTMAERAFSMDGRAVRGTVRDGSFKLIALEQSERNIDAYAEGLASRLLLHHVDPIKRMVAVKDSSKLTGPLRIAVREGRMTYEDAVVASIREGLYAGQVDILNKSVPELKRLLSTDKGLRTLLFGDNFKSYAREIENETLGIQELRKFIATGKMTHLVEKVVDGKKIQEEVELFSITSDMVKNQKQLTRFIKNQLLADPEMSLRAKQVAVPYMDKTVMSGASEKTKELIDSFFRLSSRIEVRSVYSPEYRIAYWKAVGDMAPLLSKNAAQEILQSAFDIRKTRVAELGENGEVLYRKWTENNPGFAAIEEAAKNGKGSLTRKDIDSYAQDQAAKRVSSLFYDATERNNLTYAAQLAFPFVNAWANTLKKWSELSSDPARIASRVEPAINLYETLQSKESSVFYDVTGTQHDPNQGFIWSNQYGEKVFTIPLSGYLRTLFGLVGGDPRAGDVAIPVSTLNLAFSGAAIPGSSVGVLPGVGTVWNIAYSVLDNEIKKDVPEVLASWIAPYGDKTGNIIAPLPSWLTKILRGGINEEDAFVKLSKPIMAWEATNNPKFKPLFDGTPLSLEERAALQEELAVKGMSGARYNYIMQGILQNILPGTPVYEYYAKNENGDTFMQWQLQAAFNKLVSVHNGNYDLAWSEYTNIFGREAVLSAMGQTKDAVFANNEAWAFANNHQDLFNKYNEVIPYFFTGGDFSIQYKRAMERRGKGDVLSAKELTNEADKNVIAAVRGNLAIEAVNNGYNADWIDEQMQKYKMDVLQGYEPEVTVSLNSLQQKVLKIQSALNHPEFASTPAGSAATTYFKAREIALQDSKNFYPDRKDNSLSGEDNMENRNYLRQLGMQLSQNNSDFANMFQRVLSQELKDK